MRTRSALLSAAFLCALLSPAHAAVNVTTNYFCTVVNGTAYGDNLAAAEALGWSFDTSGNGTAMSKNGYSNPASFGTSTKTISSPTWNNGAYVTKIVFGALVSDTNRKIAVFPTTEGNGSIDSSTNALTAKSTLEEVEFSYSLSEQINGFTVSVTKPGSSGTAYIYYAIVTMETPAGDPIDLPTPALLASSITSTGFSLFWSSVANADGYSAQVLDGNKTVVWSDSVSVTNATVTGLSADTVYSARVKALAPANSTDYTDSGWSMEVPVETEPAGGLKKATLFHDTFDNVAGTGWNKTGSLQNTDEPGWTTAGNVYRAPAGFRLGTENSPGAATTREIAVSNAIENAEVVVSFLAASYTGKTTAGTLTLSNTVTGAKTKLLDMSPPNMSNGTSEPLAGGTNYAITIEVPARFALRFESLSTASDKRLLLDSIKVTQVYDPNFAVLAAPTGVTSNNVEKFSFKVEWGTVANASGYEVWLDDAPIGLCDTTSTNLTRLTAGTPYKVQVRALGDNLHYGDSPLSTAISVTTLADAQKIDFTVTGAPAGDVFAGDAVSFTVTAENEATHEPAEVSFSGIAGALFNSATGAFSWTPTESDVGSHTATFSSGTYSTNVTIEVLSPNRTATLFREDFSRFITKWKGSSDPAATPLPTPDEAGWTFSNASRATSALRIGKSGNKETSAGYAVTREIVLTNNLSAGTVSLSFEAAAQFSKTGAMRVFVLDAETDATVWMAPVLPLDPIEIGSPESTTLASVAEGVHTNAAFEVSNVPERFRLRFETEPGQGTTFDCRSYLDTIVVSQTWDASVPALAAPVPAIGEPGMDSLPVSWATVEGATGYDLEARLLADGSLAARATGVTGTSHTFTGLADGTAYRVRIRSLGDGTNSANSPWSDPVTQTTVANPDRPEFSVSAGADASVVAGAAKTFAVSAARGETIVPVSFGDLSPEPAVAGSVRFSGGTFSWTPTDDDAEKTFTATFRAGSYETNVVFAVTARPPLAAPTISTNSVTWKAASLFWNEQPRATEYAVRLWRGTADYTRAGACFEDFADLTMPKGWTGVGTGWYSGYDSTRVKLDSSGDALVSKLHSAPVTNLQFHVRRAGGAVGNEDSVWHLYASSGGTTETDWKEVAYESVANGISTYVFDPSANYRRFKWVLIKGATTDACNMGIGDIEARHAGAGAKFVAGFGSIAKAQEWGLSTTLAADRLRPDTEYFLEVTATDGETSLSSTFRFRTLEANKATMMILR